MRILVITQYYPPEIGAAATRWSEYANIMTELGHDITVVSELPNYPSGKITKGYPRFRFFNEKTDNDLLTVIRVPVWANRRRTTIQRLGFYTSFMLSAVVRTLLLPKYDLIIVSSPPLFVGLIATFIRPFKKAKYALDLRDIWPESAWILGEIKSKAMLSFGRFLERLVYRSVDAFLLAVPGFREYMGQHHSAHASKPKLDLMNGVSKSFLEIIDANMHEPAQQKFTVLFSGNIGLAQGLETMIEAAELLRNEEIRFVVIGDGAKRDEVMKFADSLDLSNISFLDSMPRPLLVDQIQEAQVCLVPLIDSPLFLNAIPSKMLEYMAVGKPVIVGIRGEVEQLLTDSQAGVSIAPQNAQALADVILEYKNDPNRLQKEGLAGKSFISSKMTKEFMIEKTLTDLFEA